MLYGRARPPFRPWVGAKPNHFFAFHTGPHMAMPFVARMAGEDGVLDATDGEPHTGGHLVLRIRGTGIERASCLIRDLSILTPAE